MCSEILGEDVIVGKPFLKYGYGVEPCQACVLGIRIWKCYTFRIDSTIGQVQVNYIQLYYSIRQKFLCKDYGGEKEKILRLQKLPSKSNKCLQHELWNLGAKY